MSANESCSDWNLADWISEKQYWEKYIWKLNLERDSLTEADIEQCFQYFSEYLGIVEKSPGETNPISFNNISFITTQPDAPLPKLRLLEIKDFIGVNAIPEDCSVKFGPNLTLIYGMNGSGKSGLGRLLGNACFSRGNREILPNVKKKADQKITAGATFLIHVDDAPETQKINYTLGTDKKELKRFSIFDAKSVRIHLDEPNRVNFVPAHIRIFDKVADTISKIEHKLSLEKYRKRKENPFASMFLDDKEISSTASFCKLISASTKDEDLLKHANFNAEIDEEKILQLEKEIAEKRKLDIPKKKSQLMSDRESLKALKTQLGEIGDFFTPAKAHEVNKRIDDIREKENILQGLSVSKFDDGLFKTIGSAEWKSLISAAKLLYENEKTVNEGKEPAHCLLCHQELRPQEKALFANYWKFLSNTAETELSQLKQTQADFLETLKRIKQTFPEFLPTDAGIKILTDEDPTYLATLESDFTKLASLLDSWISRVSKFDKVHCENVSAIDLVKIDTLISTKTIEAANLTDPSKEIAELVTQLVSLKHRKAVTGRKESALEYLSWLRWSRKTDVVNFAGVKSAMTKKRTEAFTAGVAARYIEVFNEELEALGCSPGLMLSVSGHQGDTVKEYKFEFAENYNVTQILSEGEQNACSLADFLTENQIDQHNCGIVFDDPVTSLDHERKEKIARRLVIEAGRRQVIIFTHDIVFMSQLVKHANNQVPYLTHWMKNVNGIPGRIEENTSPRLANVTSLKRESENAVSGFESLKPKDQERALGIGFDHLRAACEALIEERLFANTIQRYDDHIKVQNLEEVVFNQCLALKIVELHGKISEFILAHNRSDLQRENQPQLSNFTAVRNEFDDLEGQLMRELKAARKARQERKDKKVGW